MSEFFGIFSTRMSTDELRARFEEACADEDYSDIRSLALVIMQKSTDIQKSGHCAVSDPILKLACEAETAFFASLGV